MDRILSIEEVQDNRDKVLVKKNLIRISIDLSTMPALKCTNNLAILGFVSFLAR